MGTFTVTRYQVTTNRNRPDINNFRYLLSLAGTTVDGTPVQRADVYFYPIDPPNLGYIHNEILRGALPAEDFAIWLDVLRTERGVRLSYKPDTGGKVFFEFLQIGNTDVAVTDVDQELEEQPLSMKGNA